MHQVNKKIHLKFPPFPHTSACVADRPLEELLSSALELCGDLKAVGDKMLTVEFL